MYVPTFKEIVARSIGAMSFIGSVSKIIARGKMKPWDGHDVHVGPNQLCRGITRKQLDEILKTGNISHIKQTKVLDYIKPPKPILDVSNSDIGRQVMRGDPNLLSFTRNPGTAQLYGANRYWLPKDGAIIITCLPAVFTDISEQARLCPALCDKEQEHYANAVLSKGSSGDWREPLNVSAFVIGCEEICAVIGNQNGVSFDGMLLVNSFVDKIYHVVGTGRSHFGLIPHTSCLVNAFTNPNYAERSLAVKIVLTTEPHHLEILEDTMRRVGELQADQRVLTAYDAAVIMGDPQLRELATTASESGTIILSSVPKEAYGNDMLDHIKQLLEKQIKDLSEEKGHGFKK